MVSKILYSLRSLARSRRREREMDVELQFHLDMAIQENIRRGMDPADARTEALRSFGGVEQIKEQCRDVGFARVVEGVAQDVRYGARGLVRARGFAVLSVLILALGIGANAAIFSLVYGVLLRPLPYPEGDQLVVLHQRAPLSGREEMGFSVKDILDFREQSATLAGIEEYHSMSFTLLGQREPERVRVGVVSPAFFDFLQVRPILGRSFLPGEDSAEAEAVLVLSHAYWMNKCGGDPNVVGRVFRMNDRTHTVVGVLPPLPQYPADNDLYMPTSACPIRSSAAFCDNRQARMMTVLARLKPGVTLEEAKADIATIAARLGDTYPEAYPMHQGYKVESAPLQEELTRQARPTLLLLLGATGLVLLITCANVANLTLARQMRRAREMAVRSALGAGRLRLIRQMMAESLILAVLGGALGVAVAAGALDLLVAFAERFTPRAGDVRMDGAVLAFTVVVSVVTGLVFGLIPALPSTENLTSALKQGGERTGWGTARGRARSALVVAQVAISFALLIGAGLAIRSLLNLERVDPGFAPERVLTADLSLNWSKYTEPEQRKAFFGRLFVGLEDQPGVVSTALCMNVPLSGAEPWLRAFHVEGRPAADGVPLPLAHFLYVTPNFFETLRVPVVSGRTFEATDDERAPRVAVISASMARHNWGAEDPVGKRIKIDRTEQWATIIGVVGDVKQNGLDRESPDQLYANALQLGYGSGSVFIRTVGEPENLIGALREIVLAIDPEQPISEVQTLEEVRDASIEPTRLTSMLLGLFAALALVVVVAGLGGVLALWVGERTHEIGIRLALGARPSSVLQLVIRQGLLLVGVGLLLGLASAYVLTRVMAGMLFGVGHADPLTYVAVSLVFVASSALACYAPARRATAVDPMVVLRGD